jgi:hypothetical protein
MNKIDWRDPESLRGISPAQALMVLGEITAALANRKETSETTDHDRTLATIDGSREAEEFCAFANELGRKLRREPETESFETILKRYRGQSSQTRDEGRRQVEDAPCKT